MASYKELLLKIGVDTTQLSAGIDKAKADMAGLKSVAGDMAVVGAGLTAGLTAPILGIGGAAVQAAGQMQQTVKSFETLLGSGQAAAAMLRDLENFAKSTPFEFNQLVDASKRMLAFGFEAEKVIPMLTAVGDSVAALGGNAAMVDRVTTALGQMQAKQKVSAEEMLQLTEAGIPAWDLLAKAIGVSVPEAMKLAEKGAIDAGGAIDGLISGMSQRFGGLMSQQSQTLLGQIANLQDTFAQSLTRLGQALLPFAQQAVSLAGGMVDAFASAVTTFSNLPGPIQSAGIALAGLLAAVGPVLAAAGSLVMAWTAIGPAVTAAGGAIAAVATGPIGIAVAAGAALAAGITFLADQLGILDPILAAIGGVFDNVSAAVSAVWNNLGTLAAGFGAWVSELVNSNVALNVLVGFLTIAADIVGGVLTTAFSTVAGVLKSAVIYHIDLLTQGLGWLKDKAVDLFNFFLGKGKEALGETAGSAKTAAAETKSLEKEVKALDTTATPAVKTTGAFASAIKNVGKESKDAKPEVFNLDAALRKVEASNKALEKTAQDAAKALANELARDARIASLEVVQVSTDTQDAMTKIQGFTTTAADEWSALATSASMKTAEIDAAFAALGLNTITELNTMATEAQARFETIKTSGEATPQAINTAWTDYLQKRKAAVEAAGGELTTAETNTLNALLAEQNKFKDASVGESGVFPSWATGVKDVMSGLSTDLVDALFPAEGGFSLSNVGQVLSDIGGKFKTALVQPAKDALNDLINQGINVLMGALDGLIGKLTGTGGLQSALGSVFGFGSSAASGAAGAAGSGAGGLGALFGGGGGGGASAAAGGAMSTALGWINAIGSIGTMLATIFGGPDMDTVNMHTLETANDLGNLRNDEWHRHNEIMPKWDMLLGKLDNHQSTFWGIEGTLHAIEAKLGEGITVGSFSSDAQSSQTTATQEGFENAAANLDLGRAPEASHGGPDGRFSGRAPGGFGGRIPEPTAPGDTSGLNGRAPGRSRTGALQNDPVFTDQMALNQRNPLAVAAAQAGNVLASLVTGGLFRPTETEEKIEDQTAELVTAAEDQSRAIRESEAATTSEVNGLRGDITRFLDTIRHLLDRDIVLQIDGQEIARAVGAGQEELRSTA